MSVNIATPRQAWDILSKKDNAILIDVRTNAECKYVGTPDLTSIKKEAILVPLLHFPSMDPNPQFLEILTEIISVRTSDPELFVFFMCKSGGRSQKAAEIFSEYGRLYNIEYHVFNIDKGFEGDLDNNLHRGNINGWKASKLPWGQS